MKFRPTALFDGYQLLTGGDHVLVTDENGTVKEIITKVDAGEDVREFEGILSPGFINAHCHLELSHLKGFIPEHTGLVDFVFTVITQRHFPDSEIAAAITSAENEMLANGIVAVGDICNNDSTLFQKQQGRMAYHNFIEVSGWLPEVAGARFERSKGFYDAFSLLQIANCPLSMAPHAPYSVSNDLWDMIMPYFAGKTTTIHNQETVFEDELFKRGTGDFLRMYQKMGLDHRFFKPTGKTSLQSYLPKVNVAKEVLLVHNTFTTEEDILFTSQQPINVNWCLCVNANQYIENAMPPIAMLRKHGCEIVLGTDSLASNHSLSILDEMKTISKHFPEVSLTEMLQWATLNGAQALGMDNQFGSFERGKRPGVLLIEETNTNRLQPGAAVRRLV
ncbi:MAG: amidohydrolase family protein [Bacteroidota bacterium]